MSSPQHEPGNHWSLIPAILGFCTAAMGFLGHRKARAQMEEEKGPEKCPNLMTELSALEKRHDARFERIEAAQALDRQMAADRHHELFELLRTLGPRNAS